MDVAADEGDGAGTYPFEAVCEAEFLYDTDGGGVALEEVVVVFFEPGLADAKARCEAAWGGFLFEDHD